MGSLFLDHGFNLALSPQLAVQSQPLGSQGSPSSQSVSSVAQSCPTLCNPMNHSTPGLPSITNSQSPPKPMSIESLMPSNHLILCQPILLMPSIFLSIRVFSSESALCIRWPKCWSFSFSISPSNVDSGLTSFRMDWFAEFSKFAGILSAALSQHHLLGFEIAQLEFYHFY